MLGSRSNYFIKPELQLRQNRLAVIYCLESWGYNKHQIEIYLKAFDYFCEFPKKFDGATIVKDAHDLPGLDLDAMLHDYMYIVYSCATSIYTKWHCDWCYAKQMEKKGKSYLSWMNFTLLKISGIFFYPYSRIKKGKLSIEQRLKFFDDYETLMRNN